MLIPLKGLRRVAHPEIRVLDPATIRKLFRIKKKRSFVTSSHSEGALSTGIQSSDRIESAIAGRTSYGPMKVLMHLEVDALFVRRR